MKENQPSGDVIIEEILDITEDLTQPSTSVESPIIPTTPRGIPREPLQEKSSVSVDIISLYYCEL